MNTDKIYLVGFMGSGKSTVATALGARLGWSVKDIDRVIEERERCSVADIFARRGEPYFRQLERDALRDLLPTRHMVIATGGGTFVDPVNQRAINDDGVSIWLDVSFETAIDRLPTDGSRPLAADRITMQQLWEARRDAYSLAHVRLDADRVPVSTLVERILDWAGS